MQGRYLRQVINKFMTNSEVANNARVQVYMPNGETFDVCGIQLMQNKKFSLRSLRAQNFMTEAKY
jgi:hypothetical protein